MPITITKTVFTFEELSDSAKERARQWYREGPACGGEDLSERNYDDFKECAQRLGIEFGQKQTGANRNGHPIYAPAIYWSGFWSQGDGACFEGTWRYRADSCAAIREHAPKDEELHRIADELARIHASHVLLGLKPPVSATIEHRSSHYYHSNTMSIDVEHDDDDDDRVDSVGDGSSAEAVAQLMRDFADWMYAQLEADHDYLNSDEVVDEGIIANEYTFDEEGRREG